MLPVLRHDTAHVLAQAFKELFPSGQITFGPDTEDGFYYDFATDRPLTPEDLEPLQARMQDIVKRNLPIEREEWNRDQAVATSNPSAENYKAEHIGSIPEGDVISIYRQGDWLDLCRGPHLPSTGAVGDGFTLTHIGGTHWRGDPNGDPLQRVYGTCFPDKKASEKTPRATREAEARRPSQTWPAWIYSTCRWKPLAQCSGMPRAWLCGTQ